MPGSIKKSPCYICIQKVMARRGGRRGRVGGRNKEEGRWGGVDGVDGVDGVLTMKQGGGYRYGAGGGGLGAVGG